MGKIQVGDKCYAILPQHQLYRIEQVTILGVDTTEYKGEVLEYWEVHYDESYGNGAISKEKVFKTRAQAEKGRTKIIESDHQKFVATIDTKEKLMNYLYMCVTGDSGNIKDDTYIAQKIKEYTGVDIEV